MVIGAAFVGISVTTARSTYSRRDADLRRPGDFL